MSAAPHTASSHNDRLAALARISSLLRAGMPAREAMDTVLASIPEVIPADAYAIWRYEQDAQEWRVVASSGLSSQYVSQPVAESNDERLLLEGPIEVADVFAWPHAGRRQPFYEAEGIRSLLVLPLHLRGETAGTLACYFRTPHQITDEERHMAQVLTDLVSAVINVRNFDRLYDAFTRERTRLEHSESRYRALVMAAGTRQAIWTATADGIVTEDLAGWFELTGQRPHEAREWGWMEALHPDDRGRVVAAWQHAVATRTAYQEQYRMRGPDGAYRWYAATAVPVLRDDEVFEWVGTTVDIHDRRTADEALRFLAEAGELLLSSLDYETTLRTVAQLAVPRFADWCAVDVVDEQNRQQRLAVAHVDPAKVELAHEMRRRYPPDPETDAVTRVIRTGRSEWMAVIPQDLLDASARDDEHRRIIAELGLMSYVCVPLRAHGRVLGTLTFVLSESQRRYSESDVAIADEVGRRAGIAIVNAQLYSDAQAANRAKEEFLATLSHELRTPMTAVLGWARMLRMGLTPEESHEAVTAIERSATVQMQLIEDILDMSRIMAGKMRLESVPVDFCATVDAALDTVRPTAAAKDIRLRTEYPRRAPIVRGDEPRLHQIIWNLLTNALKFTPPGGEVTVRVIGTEEVVGLQVRDTGVGIDPAFLPHVFERFRQQDSSTTRAHGGIGLGLAIVRHLVELHGGRIYAESEGRDRGATFTVELPPLHTRRPRAREESDARLPSLAGMSVLVIDDDEMTRDVVVMMLRRAGANVAAAESARAAHAMLAEAVPDVIVCDIAMPGEDGYTFVRQLRAGRPELASTRVIALTAFGRPEDRDKALASGFDGYLKKPVDPVTLAEALR